MRKKTDFDCFAENYREIHTKNVQKISGADSDYFGRYKVEIVKKQSGGGSGNRVKILDLGCGDGMNALHFEKCFPQMEYFGIDVSADSIRQAKKLEKHKIHFTCYDGTKIPYKNGSFDLIFIACVLHHVPQEKHLKLLRECRRVLKENGVLYIFEHNPWNPVTRNIVNQCVFDQDAVLVRKRTMKTMLRRTGFGIVKTAYTIFFPRKGFMQKLIWMETWLGWLPLGGQYYVAAGKSDRVR